MNNGMSTQGSVVRMRIQISQELEDFDLLVPDHEMNDSDEFIEPDGTISPSLKNHSGLHFVNRPVLK